MHSSRVHPLKSVETSPHETRYDPRVQKPQKRTLAPSDRIEVPHREIPSFWHRLRHLFISERNIGKEVPSPLQKDPRAETSSPLRLIHKVIEKLDPNSLAYLVHACKHPDAEKKNSGLNQSLWKFSLTNEKGEPFPHVKTFVLSLFKEHPTF